MLDSRERYQERGKSLIIYYNAGAVERSKRWEGRRLGVGSEWRGVGVFDKEYPKNEYKQ